MKKSFAVFGMGDFGKSIALELMNMGAEVLACDIDDTKTAAVSDYVTTAVTFNALDEGAYKKLGLSNMDGVVVSMTGSLDASVMAILKAKEANVPFVLAKAADKTQQLIFEKIGADRVAIPEELIGRRLARSLATRSFLDYVDISDKIKMVEIKISEKWIGRSIAELDIRNKYGITVIAIKRADELLTYFDPTFLFEAGDNVIIIADNKRLNSLKID